VDLFSQRAQEVLYFRCSSCDQLKSLAVEEDTIRWFALQQLEAYGLPRKVATFILRKYESGIVTQKQAYIALRRHLPALRIAKRLHHFADEDVKLATELMRYFLGLVKDPERRAALHLFHLSKVPRFFTPCCQMPHCYKCCSSDWHFGWTCEEFRDQMIDENADGGLDIVSCEECGVQLMKGDGCNSVTCICGCRFRWNERLHFLRRTGS